MQLNIGDLYYFDVAFVDNPSEYKNRPVLLLNEDKNKMLLLVSTTSKPRNHPMKRYDRYKIPIHNWRRTGLTKASWCQGANLISLPREEVESLITPGDFIGRMHQDDFNFIIEELEKIHNR